MKSSKKVLLPALLSLGLATAMPFAFAEDLTVTAPDTEMQFADDELAVVADDTGSVSAAKEEAKDATKTAEKAKEEAKDATKTAEKAKEKAKDAVKKADRANAKAKKMSKKKEACDKQGKQGKNCPVAANKTTVDVKTAGTEAEVNVAG